MLRVKTYIDKSPINGIGLFAAEFIPKGKVIWKLDHTLDLILPHHHSNDFFKKYSYRDGNNYILCIDDARFMNHSEDANTKNGNLNETIASRDIIKGEEMTCNYYEIDDDAKLKLC